MNEIHQVHDKFFKHIISNKENAKSFIEFALPKEITDYIDYSTLEPLNTEKISKRYKRFSLDAAFRFKAKQKTAQVYMILEHKSESTSFSSIQILSYMLAIWEENLKNKKPLEPIIAIVFYHGKTSWDKPTEFLDNFEDKDLFSKYLPKFEYILLDTNITPDETFQFKIQNRYLLVALLILKHIFQEEGIEVFYDILNLIKDANIDDFIDLLEYIINVRDLNEEEIKTVLESTIGGDKMAPIIEKWIQKGREEGIEKGIMDGMILDAQELLLDAIEAKFGNVPKEIKLLIKNTNDREKLRSLHKIAIKAQSLDEVKNALQK
ncbi:MAG: Rpn family recombination-promoting nuclease/putative transposase [Desulfurella sp.]|uniref:Rpn family recombination-promoting nuclease/putative transposase n=1 Tax=Desulfurella sp. TaxID=1962857 RepID=UPI003D0A654D